MICGLGNIPGGFLISVLTAGVLENLIAQDEKVI